MTRYILERLAWLVPVLLGVSLIVFMIVALAPGDAARAVAGTDATQADIENIRHQLGLDQPLPVQYALWMQHALSGDLGKSYISRLPVAQLIGNALPATLELTLAALLIAVVVGIPSGILSAVHRSSSAEGGRAGAAGRSRWLLDCRPLRQRA